MPFPDPEIEVIPTPPPDLAPDARTNVDRLADLANLQALIEALEKGGYDSKPGKLEQGSALKIESLEPTLKVVTFGDPTRYLNWVKWCNRLSKFLYFFGARGPSAMFYEAGIYFQKEADRLSVRLRNQWKKV